MPSQAFDTHLEPVLADADEINTGHANLRTGTVGRQYGLGALNRAVVVMCVSAWEAYVEEVTKECLELLRPDGAHAGTWPALNAATKTLIGRFNNPNAQNTQSLFRDGLGFDNITRSWTWTRMTPGRAREKLDEAIRIRHQVAHGVTPRPVVHNQQYASRLPNFFRKLATATDQGITDVFATEYGITTGW